jgi:hypothetical protein
MVIGMIILHGAIAIWIFLSIVVSIAVFVFSAIVIVLQIHLSSRESKGPGLVLPSLTFLFSIALFVIIDIKFNSAAALGIDVYVLFFVALFNIPTAALIAVYVVRRRALRDEYDAFPHDGVGNGDSDKKKSRLTVADRIRNIKRMKNKALFTMWGFTYFVIFEIAAMIAVLALVVSWIS